MLPPLPSKPLADLTEADLLRLVEDEVREDVEIDYKVRLETDCQEFARDISAFANSKGGYLVYGMSEVDELPNALVPLEGFDPGTAIGRMTSWAQEHVRPRPTLQFKPVQLEAGGAVMVVEVPRSWVGPHEVRQEHRFYHRTQHGKAPMDVDQLRLAFSQDRDFLHAVETFHARRIDHWLSRTPGLGVECAIFVLHLLPAEGLLGRRRVTIAGTAFERYYPVPHPSTNQIGPKRVWGGGTTHSYNLDGFEFREVSGVPGERCSCQVFRNGGVEHKHAVRVDSDGLRVIRPIMLEQWIDRALDHAATVMGSLGSQGPVAVAGSFLGTTGWAWPRGEGFTDQVVIHDPELRLPEVLLDSVDAPTGPAAEQLANYLWNVVGEERSPNFQDGVFAPPPR